MTVWWSHSIFKCTIYICLLTTIILSAKYLQSRIISCTYCTMNILHTYRMQKVDGKHCGMPHETLLASKLRTYVVIVCELFFVCCSFAVMAECHRDYMFTWIVAPRRYPATLPCQHVLMCWSECVRRVVSRSSFVCKCFWLRVLWPEWFRRRAARAVCNALEKPSYIDMWHVTCADTIVPWTWR